jgi:hypothetical protein
MLQWNDALNSAENFARYSHYRPDRRVCQ